MKRVLIVGLKDYQNLGDQLLVYVTELVCRDLGYETISADFRANKRKHFFRYFLYGVVAKISKLIKSQRLKCFAWNIRNSSHIRKNLKNVGAVIIACGNLMYSSHVINCMYETVIKEAKKKNIPVMLSSMSVEEARENDYRFNRLKKILSSENVCCFTTRDGYRGLEKFKKYKSKQIISETAIDIAYLSDSFIKKREKTETIGVNVISGFITNAYSEKISAEKLKRFYHDVFRRLEAKKIRYKVFTTGMVEDESFIDYVLRDFEIKGERVPVVKSINELYETIIGFDRVLGSRMHSCIISHTLKIPIVGIIWDDKLRNYAKTTGQENNFLCKNDLDGAKAVDLLLSETPENIDYSLTDDLKYKTKGLIGSFLENSFKENK